jgi:hypothetical protein
LSTIGESDPTKIVLTGLPGFVRSSYTPSKRARVGLATEAGSPASSTGDDSWVMSGLFDREVLPKMDAVDVSGCKAVEILERNLKLVNSFFQNQQDDLTGSFLKDVKDKVNALVIANGRLNGLVGRPQGFGAEYDVASPIDAIRYLNDSISERLGREFKPFVETPYATMVKRVRLLSTDVSLLEGQMEHYDASHVTKVEATITEL